MVDSCRFIPGFSDIWCTSVGLYSHEVNYPSFKPIKLYERFGKTLIYCFDIDETICTSNDLDYEGAKPILERIDFLNDLYKSGNIIKFYTARGSKTGIDWYAFTENQLKSWGVNYHELHVGKPFADIYIDDKAINSEDFEW